MTLRAFLMAFAACGALWATAGTAAAQDAGESEEVRQMRQDEADQQAEADRLEAEQADRDQMEAEQADMDRRDDARSDQQQRDLQAAEELADAMDDEAALDAEIDAMEQRLAEMDERRNQRVREENASTREQWAERENARLAECRVMYAGAIRGIHAQYDAKALEIQRSGVGDHIAEQLSGLQAAREQVVNSLLDEQCMPEHERRAREANQRGVDQVREGAGSMPVIPRPPAPRL